MAASTIFEKNDDHDSRSVKLRFGLGILLSILSGVMLLLAFPPYGLWLLAWFALVPGLIAQYRLLPAKWSSLAPAIYLGIWLGLFLGRLFGSEFGPVFQFMGIWIAIFIFFVSKDRKFHEITGYRWWVLQGVISWVGFEMIRATFIPLLATSGFIGYTQSTQPWLIQPVSLTSIYGLNILIILCNYALGYAALAWLDQRMTRGNPVKVLASDAHRWLIQAGIALALWIAISLLILNTFPAGQPAVKVASLRPNLPLPAFQDKVNTSQVRMNVFSEQAREAAAQGAKIIYTPEMMFNFDPQVEFTNELRELAKATDAYLFITYTVSAEGQDWRNEAVMLSPQGEFSLVYGKNKVWGIGEPLSPSAGHYPVFDTPLGKLATLICHDANYTDVMRKLAANDAQIVAAPYREFGGFGEQAWTNALFRAVENRTAVIISGVATVSGIINPDGSLVALDTDIDGSRVTLTGEVTPGPGGGTPYTKIGDLVGWLALVGYILFMVFQAVVEGRAKKAANTHKAG